MNGRMSCHDVSFDDEAMRAMGEAFDRVCDVLGDFGAGATVDEIIARRIVEAAQMGERDPSRLYLQTLNALGIDEKSAVQLAA
jgi:hypothetical protein